MSTRVRREVAKFLASIRRAGGPGHLDDRELVRIALDAGANPAAQDTHLAGCARCAARVSTLQAGLGRMAAVAEAAFDDAVPPWRLVRQRRHILRRIQRTADRRGSARILRFPSAGGSRTAGSQPLRWRLSLAIPASLLVALGIGQMIDGRREPADSPRPAAAVAPSQAIVGPPAGQPQIAADEQFMRELEEALTSSRVTPLVALDEMTPRVRDVAIDIR